MTKTKIDGIKLKEAIGQFGSLQEAAKNLESKNEALGKEANNRKKEINQLESEKDKLLCGIEELKKQFDQQKQKLESLVSEYKNGNPNSKRTKR